MDLDACFGCGAATFDRIDGKWCESCNRIATTHLPLVPLTDEQVRALSLPEATVRLAAELIDLHIATGIDLDFWPVARHFITLASVPAVHVCTLDAMGNCTSQQHDWCNACNACTEWKGEVCVKCGAVWGEEPTATGHRDPLDEEPYDFTTDHHHYRKVPGGTVPASIENCQLCGGGDFT